MLFEPLGIIMLIIIGMCPFLCIYSFRMGYLYGKGENPKPILPKRVKTHKPSEEELALAKRLDEINNFEFGENK